MPDFNFSHKNKQLAVPIVPKIGKVKQRESVGTNPPR